RARERLSRALALDPGNPLAEAALAVVDWDSGHAAALDRPLAREGFLPDRLRARILLRLEAAAIDGKPLPAPPDPGPPGWIDRWDARRATRAADRLLARGK